MTSFKLHPHCLAKDYAEESSGYLTPEGEVAGLAIFHTKARDNDQPEADYWLSISSNVKQITLNGLTPEERVMFNMLTHYIHEAGEHITFDSGVTFNQHESEGHRRLAKVVEYVSRHLNSF